MPITPTHDEISLRELIDELERGAVKVNLKYQRSGQIWPLRAQSFLVETVLRGMPIPRVLLHDLGSTTGTHRSDIIDGQQRCNALRRFRNNGYALTTNLDDDNLHGKYFRDLTPHQRGLFDDYPVPIDRYRNVTPLQIRHVFRRLNYYTAPLNAAEQRHAQFFGELSRFVEDQATAWRPTLRLLRVFTEAQLSRKADEQLLAEIVDAMLNGISTPTAKSLRDVYQNHEHQFPSAADFGRKLERANEQLARWGDIRGTLLVKHYQIFSLSMALMHAQSDLASVRTDLGAQHPVRSDTQVLRAFEPLERALRTKATRGLYAPFWTASQEKTNVRENRLRRCRYFYVALTGYRPALRRRLRA